MAAELQLRVKIIPALVRMTNLAHVSDWRTPCSLSDQAARLKPSYISWWISSRCVLPQKRLIGQKVNLAIPAWTTSRILSHTTHVSSLGAGLGNVPEAVDGSLKFNLGALAGSTHMAGVFQGEWWYGVAGVLLDAMPDRGVSGSVFNPDGLKMLVTRHPSTLCPFGLPCP